MALVNRHNEVSLGSSLAKLRDTAGLTQADLAEKLGVSPARVSRIESGSVDLSPGELDHYLDAIDTKSAGELKIFLAEKWTQIERPPFEHPSREALWLVNGVLGKLRKLKAEPELKNVFVRHIENYEDELGKLGRDLCSLEHRVAFVGSIGVGKTIALCSVSDLRVTEDGPLNGQVALEAGAGGTTVCEVHIKMGPQFGILVEPRTEEEIEFDVIDFAEYLLRRNKDSLSTEIQNDEQGPGISKEVSRAIRNMSGLAETKKKDKSTGSYIRDDPARRLAEELPNLTELVVKILSRMDLPGRDCRHVWYDESIESRPLDWMKRTFTEINNGRNSQFSLPRRMEVVVPKAILGDAKLDIRIVDTKGIDGAATRADLDRLFDDRRTIVVLCSKFNDAPEITLQQLLERVREAGARDIVDQTVLLVLPRPEEAEAVKDDSGFVVEDELEGYELKQADVEMRLTGLGLYGISIGFFNARSEEPAALREILLARVHHMRAVWEERVKSLATAVEDLISNHDEEQTVIVFRDVMKRLNTWLAKNRDMTDINESIDRGLLKAIGLAHWRSVFASVRRKGKWNHLDYYHEIGFGARSIAAKHIRSKTKELEIIIQNLTDDDELSPAHDFLAQVVRTVRSETDEIVRKMEIVGKAVFEGELKADIPFWNDLEDIHGTGYRDRVATNSAKWFELTEHKVKHTLVKTKIEEGWKEILASLDRLLSEATEE